MGPNEVSSGTKPKQTNKGAWNGVEIVGVDIAWRGPDVCVVVALADADNALQHGFAVVPVALPDMTHLSTAQYTERRPKKQIISSTNNSFRKKDQELTSLPTISSSVRCDTIDVTRSKARILMVTSSSWQDESKNKEITTRSFVWRREENRDWI